MLILHFVNNFNKLRMYTLYFRLSVVSSQIFLYILLMKNQNIIQKAKVNSLSTNIACDLRSKIIIGEIKGGTPLKQDSLAQQYNISISTLREALKILEGEGLVAFTTNRGAIITKLSATEALNIFEIRIMLECGALSASMPYFDETHLSKLHQVLEKEASCDDTKLYNELNTEFHALLYEKANNPKLLELIKLLHNNVGRYLVFYLNEMSFKEQSHYEHLQLLTACQNKDTAAAKRLLKKHMQSAGKCLAKYLSNNFEKGDN